MSPVVNFVLKRKCGQYAWVPLCTAVPLHVLNKAVLQLWKKRMVSGCVVGLEGAFP